MCCVTKAQGCVIVAIGPSNASLAPVGDLGLVLMMAQ